ncbi:MAG: helix-turn-helix transcriptional regulator [Patescibacteria group bacterium]
MRGNYIYGRLGKCVSAARKKRGLTQEDLSGITCLHRTHIARLERGELNPSFWTLLSLSRKLKISLSYLLRGIK